MPTVAPVPIGPVPIGHPLRRSLNDELHARPFTIVEAPEHVLHLAILSRPGGGAEDHRRLARVCAGFGVTPPEAGNHFAHDFGHFRLKWERHTEFATYTLFAAGSRALTEPDPLLAQLPADWLEALGSDLLVACRIAVERRDAPSLPHDVVDRLGTMPLAGNRVLGNGAEVWTDFRIHEDGLARILLIDLDLRERQSGRLVQRLLEIETYRMMALLGLPHARAAMGTIQSLGDEIARITEAMAREDGADADRALLARVMGVAAQVEQLAAANGYRLSAAAAYHALVEARLAELRESRIEGLPTLSEFLDRRLAPAMATCRHAVQRQEALSQRLARSAELLRTRVDIQLEDQNRAVLQSMDRRAHLQLRLQETVEGLSVIAISYYLIALIGHVLSGVAAAGIALPAEILDGALVPVVLFLVALAAHRVRRRLARD
ncbi:hypothetical protein GCM10011611_48660 [Aliidongia dinghuensis]|uniref:DUF3422 domain-containing protein n=2 Tax=Aliidongia dinghuensis TaxID=1867774 RepID=A0A8J2YZ87_9PROT|nr:hypothetical protein GCM10011611_48660 [Aliidongia dinghuensis]